MITKGLTEIKEGRTYVRYQKQNQDKVKLKATKTTTNHMYHEHRDENNPNTVKEISKHT